MTDVKKVGYTGRILPSKLKKLHDLKWKKKTNFSGLMDEIIDYYFNTGGHLIKNDAKLQK